MKPLSLLGLSFCLVAVAATTPLAQPAGNGELARIEARLTRLEGLLNEQKQLLEQLIRSLQVARETAPASAAPKEVAAVTVAGRVAWTQGSQEAYVYLEGPGAGRGRAAEIRQEGKQFYPPVVVLPVGSRLTFPNGDIVFHNVFSRSPAAVFDLGTIKGGETAPPVTLSRPGHVEIFCNIHPNMRADILVVPNDHYTKVRPDGAFSLPAVPAGSRKLVLWGPRLKPVSQTVEVQPGVSVTFNGEPATPRVHLNKSGRAYGSYDE
jgi:plastocyanin